jgi:hypothetical protein
MACTVSWSEETRKPESIAGDRRRDRRYPIPLELRWKLIRRKRVLDTGVGRTLDLSSGGLLFESGRQMTPGLNVELAISWPALLHNVAPMQLIVHGRIVRSDGARIAIRIVQHEFRTVGILTNHRGVPTAAARAHSSMLANINVASLGKIQ